MDKKEQRSGLQFALERITERAYSGGKLDSEKVNRMADGIRERAERMPELQRGDTLADLDSLGSATD